MDDFNIGLLKRFILVALSNLGVNVLSSYKNIDNYSLYALFEEFYSHFYDFIVFHPSRKSAEFSTIYDHMLDNLALNIDDVKGFYHLGSSRIYRHAIVESIYTISDFFPCLYMDFFGCNTVIKLDDERELFHVIVPFNDDSLDELFPFTFLESCLDNLLYTQSLFNILNRR